MSSLKKFFEQQDRTNALLNLGDAMESTESPEQTAARLQKAREFNVSPKVADALNPSEVNRFYAEEALKSATPLYMQKAGDSDFANLTKDDIPGLFTLETAWHKLMPKPGASDTWAGIFGNSLARGGYALANTAPGVGNVAQIGNAQDLLNKIDQVEYALQNGLTAKDIFATAIDPEGTMGLQVFEASKEKAKQHLLASIQNRAEDISQNVDSSARYPKSEAGQKLADAETVSEALGVIGESPVSTLLDIGPESFVQILPMLPMLALTGGSGLLQAGLTAGYSHSLDESAGILEGLSNAGVNLADSQAVYNFITNPLIGQIFQWDQIKDEAGAHADITALFDAISAGVAGKFLLPKAVGTKLGKSKELANIAVQTPIQTGLGMAGEAGGQVAAYGEVTSVSEVISEGLGEMFGTPGEVLSAGIVRLSRAKEEQEKAQQMAQAIQEVVKATQATKLIQRDPQTAMEYVDDVTKDDETNEPRDIILDGQSLHQAGVTDQLKAVLPEYAEKIDMAVASGGEIRIPMGEFAVKVGADEGLNTALAEYVYVDGQMSLHQAKDIQDEIMAQSSKAAEEVADDAVSEEQRAFRESTQQVREAIAQNFANQVQEGGAMVSKEEQATATTLFTTLISTLAKDAGMLPMELWQSMGARFLGPKQAEQLSDGRIKLNAGVVNKPRFHQADNKVFASAVEGDRELITVDGSTDFARLPAEAFTNAGLDDLPIRFTVREGNELSHALDHNRQINEAKRGDSVSLAYEILNDPDQVRINQKADGLFVWAKLDGEKGGYAVVKLDREGAQYNVTSVAWVSRLDKYIKNQGPVVWERAHIRSRPTAPGAFSGQTTNSEETVPQSGALDQENKGDYLPDLRTIIRWVNADQSTMLHEFGHLFLDMRINLIQDLKGRTDLTEGQKHLVDTTEAVLKWLGTDLDSWSKMSLDEKRPMHEKFATTFEAYLFTGEAPTRGLRSVFRQYARWLKKVYLSIAGIPGVEMSDDVRVLFDQLFITSEQVQEARFRRNMFRLFNTWQDMPAEATPEEIAKSWAEYEKLYKDSEAEAEEYLRARGMRDMAYIANLRGKTIRKLRKAAKTYRDAIYDEEWENVAKEPVYQAYWLLSSGETVNGKRNEPKLTKSELKDLGLSAEEIKRLDELDMVGENEGGIEVGEDVAKRFGYDSLSALVHDLLSRPRFEEAVTARTDERMFLEHAELASEEDLIRTADEAIFNPSAERVLVHEIRALDRAQGKGKGYKQVELDTFRELASAQVGKTKISKLKPHAHRMNASARAKEAMKNLANVVLARRAKAQQLFQTCLANEAQKQKAKAEKIIKYFTNLAKAETKQGVDQSYLVQAQHTIAKLGFVPTKPRGKTVTPKDSLESFSNDLQANGKMIPIVDDRKVDSIVNGAQMAKLGPKDLTVDQLTEVYEAVRQIMKLGRDEGTATINGQKLEVQMIASELAQAVTKQAEERGRKKLDERESDDPGARRTYTLRKLGMAHARIPSLLAAMEGTRTGKFFDYIVSGAQKASDFEERLKNELSIKLDKACKPLWEGIRRSRRKRIWHDSVGQSLSHEEVIAVALNMGNDSNKVRLLNGEGWTEEQAIQLISETLSKEELEAVQNVWNLFDELWPQLEDQQIRMFGKAVARVPATNLTVTLADGTEVKLKGGYYPVAYDNRRSRGQHTDETLALDQMLSGAKTSSRAFAGFLKNRVGDGEGRPLTLTLRAGFEGLTNEVHELAWQEWLVDTSKILRNKTLDSAIRSYWGPDAFNAINDWVRDIAMGTRRQSVYGDSVGKLLRYNLSLVGLGFNLVTAAIQPIGYTQSVVVLGGKWASVGMGQFLSKGPRSAWKEVCEKSSMMAGRSRTRFRELTEIQAKLNGNTSSIQDRFMRAAYMPIVFTQMLVDVPTWLGGYNKALSEGKTEEQAIAIADRLVIDAQGSGRMEDLSALERGGELSKLFTVFYTFFNAALNIAMVSRHTESGIKRAFNLLLILAFQPIIETFVREGLKELGGTDSDDEWWERAIEKSPWAVAQFNAGLLVGVRELSSMFDPEFNQYSGPAGLRKAADFGRMFQQVMQGELDEALMKSVITVAGEWSPFAVPVVPVTRFMSGVNALNEGKTDSWLAPFLGYSKY